MLDGLGWYDAVGTLGTLTIVSAYFASQIGWVMADDIRFPLANLVGAVLISVSLIYNFNLASALMEGFWITISLIGITRNLRRRSRSAGS